MNMPKLSEMENNILRLSLDEQLWLVERMVHNIRENSVQKKRNLDDELLAMANDPQIQKELRDIEEEFAFAESDGLDF